MLCEFVQITERNEQGTAEFQCKTCGRIAYRVRSKSADKIIAHCNPEKQSKPLTLADMAAAATRAATRFVADGGVMVSSEVLAERNAICRDCPKHLAMLNSCSECGCFLTLKARMPAETCPLGKW